LPTPDVAEAPCVRATPGDAASPIVFMHGVGLGVFPYLGFVWKLLTAFRGTHNWLWTRVPCHVGSGLKLKNARTPHPLFGRPGGQIAVPVSDLRVSGTHCHRCAGASHVCCGLQGGRSSCWR
jgi:hypothetical protein